jgi:hypothetical protein
MFRVAVSGSNERRDVEMIEGRRRDCATVGLRRVKRREAVGTMRDSIYMKTFRRENSCLHSIGSVLTYLKPGGTSRSAERPERAVRFARP